MGREGESGVNWRRREKVGGLKGMGREGEEGVKLRGRRS
jgi:hypothetical protein